MNKKIIDDQIPIMFKYNVLILEKNNQNLKEKTETLKGKIINYFYDKDDNFFTYEVITETNEMHIITDKEIIKSNNNLINEDIQNLKNIKFKYFDNNHNGKLVNIEDDIYNIIGEDNLLYRIRKENIINE